MIDIEEFMAAYEQPDLDVFMSFCQKNNLINDDVIALLEEAYGKEWLNNLLESANRGDYVNANH